MNNLDWNIVIKLKELSEHLYDKDLIELSMCCKKSRKLLIKEAFNTFNLLSFTSSKDYSSITFKANAGKYDSKFNTFDNPYKPLNSELIESKKEFSNDLKLFYGSQKNLVVKDYESYHYLLSEISSIFHNITTLVFKDSTFTMDVLQSLFDNFKCLKNLELRDNSILHDAEKSTDYTISYPISLKSLKLRSNHVVMIKDKTESIVNNRYIVEAKTYQHLPNLVVFDQFLGFSSIGNKIELFEFIKLNPQLKCLRIEGDQFYFELFDIIKDRENLTHLKLDCVINSFELNEYTVPSLRHIKHLHLVCIDEDYNSILMYHFPHVTEYVFEFSGDYTRKNKWFIEHFGLLKKLKLIFKKQPNYDKRFTINDMPHLETIEVNYKYEKGKFDPLILNLKACRKFNLITYTKNAADTPFENPESNENLIKNSEYLYFPHKLAYHY